jgi:hypothetical protein
MPESQPKGSIARTTTSGQQQKQILTMSLFKSAIVLVFCG